MKKYLHLLLVLFFVNLISAQNQPNDCVNAIVVCGNGTFSSNATGIGTLQEVAGCGGLEHNSLWMKINIVQSGTLGFNLIPNDPAISVDYDFWVYGPNKTCGSLGAPIRCSTTNATAAGLPNNHTGMNGSSLSTTAGPGANGTGYVRWLDVKVGEFYYIAIDRPVGESGFQIQWTGTATTGTGAFPTPPTANKIPDLIICALNFGFFNLDSVKSQINSEPNTAITFYETLANATDGKNSISSLVTVPIANSPKTIYAKVVSNLGGCYTITDFNLRVFPLPTASVSSSKTQVCSGENVTVTITGTPGATVDYTVNGGSVQSVLLDAATGTFVLAESVTSNRTYALTRAKILDGNGNEVCFTPYAPPLTVTVTANPLPTISGKTSIHVTGSTQLTGSGTPAASYAWTSSKPSIATVSSTGLVSGVSVGSVAITYTDINGCSRVFNLVVTSNLAVENPTLKDFNAKVYPNPFNTAFVIDVNTLSQEPLKIKVYDMLGRLVEQMEGTASKMANQKLGQNYASGIYNVVVTQEDQMKTVRIIKE